MCARELQDRLPQPGRGVQVRKPMAVHLPGPCSQGGLVELARVGLADDRTEIMPDRQGLGPRQRLDVQLEVLRQQLADDDGPPGNMGREHALAQVGRKMAGSLDDTLGVVGRHGCGGGQRRERRHRLLDVHEGIVAVPGALLRRRQRRRRNAACPASCSPSPDRPHRGCARPSRDPAGGSRRSSGGGYPGARRGSQLLVFGRTDVAEAGTRESAVADRRFAPARFFQRRRKARCAMRSTIFELSFGFRRARRASR